MYAVYFLCRRSKPCSTRSVRLLFLSYTRLIRVYAKKSTTYILYVYVWHIRAEYIPKLTNNNKKKDVNIATGISFIYGLFSSFLHSVFVSFSSFLGRLLRSFSNGFQIFSSLYLYAVCGLVCFYVRWEWVECLCAGLLTFFLKIKNPVIKISFRGAHKQQEKWPFQIY